MVARGRQQARHLYVNKWPGLLEWCGQKCWPAEVWQELPASMDKLSQTRSQTRRVFASGARAYRPFPLHSWQQVHFCILHAKLIILHVNLLPSSLLIFLKSSLIFIEVKEQSRVISSFSLPKFHANHLK